MHLTREPAILYFGTPVVLISTLNPDGSANLAPMSSIFWLGWRCMIGLGGAEFRLPLLIGVFGFLALQAVILNRR